MNIDQQNRTFFMENENILPYDLGAHLRRQVGELGITFGKQVEETPVFTTVTFPTEGWSKVATDNPENFWVLDERGRIRIVVNISGNGADLWIARRYEPVVSNFAEVYQTGKVVCRVVDNSQISRPVIFCAEREADENNREEATTEVHREAILWLRNNYPDWENNRAYWE